MKKIPRISINGSVIILLAVIFVLSVFLTFRLAQYKNELYRKSATTSYVDPARVFYDSDDLVINIQPLRNELSPLEKNQNISVYFEVLNTGANLSINKDIEFFPASLLKVPLIMAAVKNIESGKTQWGTKLAIKEEDKNKDFGTLWKLPSGTQFSIEELVRKSLVDSDNTAYFVLLNNIDNSEIVKVHNYLGLYDFVSEDLGISAKKYAPILRSLFSATYLSVEDSEKILKWMSESSFTNYLARGIPKGVKFAHKIGVESNKKTYLDAGIVYLPNRPYIVIVMVKNYEENQADAIMQDISKRIYNYMVNYPQGI